MPSRLSVVTGGSRGIGRAVVLRLAAAGDRVVALGRDEDALRETVAAAGANASCERCDVTDETAVDALFERLGAVDLLVANAGWASAAPVHRTSLDDWERMLAVNATGVFLCVRAALRGMRQRDRGRIVLVSSVAGLVGLRYTGAYGASKHAALGLMRAAAAEVAGSGVTINAVCPAYVRSDMTDASVQRIIDKTGRSAEEATKALAGMSALGRLLEPEEVADAVAYLAAESSAAINGQTLTLDGGSTQS